MTNRYCGLCNVCNLVNWTSDDVIRWGTRPNLCDLLVTAARLDLNYVELRTFPTNRHKGLRYERYKTLAHMNYNLHLIKHQNLFNVVVHKLKHSSRSPTMNNYHQTRKEKKGIFHTSVKKKFPTVL